MEASAGLWDSDGLDFCSSDDEGADAAPAVPAAPAGAANDALGQAPRDADTRAGRGKAPGSHAGSHAGVHAAKSASGAANRFRKLAVGVVGSAMCFGNSQAQGQAWGSLLVLQRHGHPSHEEMGSGITLQGPGEDCLGEVLVSCGRGVNDGFVGHLRREAMDSQEQSWLVEVTSAHLTDPAAFASRCKQGGEGWSAVGRGEQQQALVLFRRVRRIAIATNSTSPGSERWGTSVLLALHREGQFAGQGGALVCFFDGTSAQNFSGDGDATLGTRFSVAKKKWLHKGHFPQPEAFETRSHALLRYTQTKQDVEHMLQSLSNQSLQHQGWPGWLNVEKERVGGVAALVRRLDIGGGESSSDPGGTSSQSAACSSSHLEPASSQSIANSASSVESSPTRSTPFVSPERMQQQDCESDKRRSDDDECDMHEAQMSVDETLETSVMDTSMEEEDGH